MIMITDWWHDDDDDDDDTDGMYYKTDITPVSVLSRQL
jgi:hypothetical protein